MCGMIPREGLDYFDCIHVDSEDIAGVTALAVFPYISGSPHSIRYVAETPELIACQPGALV